VLALVALACTWGARGARAAECKKVVLEGEVAAGHEWNADLGQGWVFRLLPIAAGQAGYSGWDLVMDRKQGAGYPDALLLATLPYASLNEREIGTTFGLRAQDAIGWNPRSFRFLTDPGLLHEGQRLFLSLLRNGRLSRTNAGTSTPDAAADEAMVRLLALQQHASTGEFRIVDARLVPGTADAASYAQNWALAASRTPHENVAPPSGKASARGSLEWMRFSMTLWLPRGWALAGHAQASEGACPD
jgi:hypothetical protein